MGRSVSDVFVKIKGPLYDDGSGSHFEVEFDGQWGHRIGKPQPRLTIRQFSDSDVIINMQHIPALIEALQDIQGILSICDTPEANGKG